MGFQDFQSYLSLGLILFLQQIDMSAPSRRQGPVRRRRTRQPVQQVSQHIGRPSDPPIQHMFMQMLRSGKLYEINSESEAEIFADQAHLKDEHPQDIAHRLLEGNSDSYSSEKIEAVKGIFYEKDQLRFEALFEGFMLGVKNWQFEELEEDNFPKYLFCDSFDLSYVLQFIINCDLYEFRNRTEFASDELLFLELLCFAYRDMISFKVIHSIEHFYPRIVEGMADIKDKVKASRNDAQNEAPAQDVPENQSQMEQEEQEEEREQGLLALPKTKQIKKPPKKKAGRPKKRGVYVPEWISEDDMDQMALRFKYHIGYSYRYILDEQINKKRALAQQAERIEEDVGSFLND